MRSQTVDPSPKWQQAGWGGGGFFYAAADHPQRDGGSTWIHITGDIPHVKPQLLRFNSETNELWAGGVGLYKLMQ